MGTQLPITKKGVSLNFQPMSIVAKWLDGSRCQVGMPVGLGPSHIVLDGDPAPHPIPKNGTEPPPVFGPCLLWPRSAILATAELLFVFSFLYYSFFWFYVVDLSGYLSTFGCTWYSLSCHIMGKPSVLWQCWLANILFLLPPCGYGQMLLGRCKWSWTVVIKLYVRLQCFNAVGWASRRASDL